MLSTQHTWVRHSYFWCVIIYVQGWVEFVRVSAYFVMSKAPCLHTEPTVLVLVTRLATRQELPITTSNYLCICISHICVALCGLSHVRDPQLYFKKHAHMTSVQLSGFWPSPTDTVCLQNKSACSPPRFWILKVRVSFVCYRFLCRTCWSTLAITADE